MKVNCKNCQKEFSTIPSRVKDGRGKFCSKKCFYITQKGIRFAPIYEKGHKPWNTGKKREHMTGEKNWKWKGGKPKCIDCGKQLSAYKSIRCNHCMGVYMKGENHWNWKEGITATYGKRWTDKNRDKKYYSNHKRLMIKKNIEGSHTLEEWKRLKKSYQYMCLCCKKQEPEIILSEDHIIPISKGGTDYIHNIQPLCRSCNSIKHTKTIDYRKEVFFS